MNTPDSPNSPAAPRQEPPQESPQWAKELDAFVYRLGQEFDRNAGNPVRREIAWRNCFKEFAGIVLARYAPPPAAPVEAQGGELAYIRDALETCQYSRCGDKTMQHYNPVMVAKALDKVRALLSRPVAPVGEAAPQSSASLGEEAVEKCAEELAALTTLPNHYQQQFSAILRRHLVRPATHKQEGAAPRWSDKDRLDFFERVAFCAYRVEDSGFIHVGLAHGVSSCSGLTLREAIDNLADEQFSYERELQAKKEL